MFQNNYIFIILSILFLFSFYKSNEKTITINQYSDSDLYYDLVKKTGNYVIMNYLIYVGILFFKFVIIIIFFLLSLIISSIAIAESFCSIIGITICITIGIVFLIEFSIFIIQNCVE